jgi:hypothetical protein
MITNKKSKLTATFAIVLLMVSAFAIMVIPTNAQEPLIDNGSIPLPSGVTPDETYQAIAHMSFRPNPVGVNQPILVNLWLQPPVHVNKYFKDCYLVTLTNPTGQEIEIGPISSYQGDATAWFEYTPTEVGTWQIQFDFLGAYFPAGYYNTTGSFQHGALVNFNASAYYLPDTDGPYDLVVQEEQVLSWPPAPLPTDYWTRPVSIENREWWPILGNYPPTGITGYPGVGGWPEDTNRYINNYDFVPYVQGPKSAHIVWKRQDNTGGLIGGPAGIFSFTSGGNTPSIIFNGLCYDTVTKVVDGEMQSVWECYDLRTGEVYWDMSDTSRRPNMISYFGVIIETVPGEAATTRAGGIDVGLLYVGGGRYIKYNPWSMSVMYDIDISPLSSATFYADPWFLSTQNLGGGEYRLVNWTIIGDQWFPSGTNFRMGVLNNISWPFSALGTVDFEAGVAVETYDMHTPATGGVGAGFDVEYDERLVGASLETGEVLWNITCSEFAPLGIAGVFSGSSEIADHGKFALRMNDGHLHCWNIKTGEHLWESELSSWPWGTFGNYGSTSYGGMLLEFQYDAIVAYDWDDGSIIWEYKAPTPYQYETPYYDGDHVGMYPWFTGTAQIADGVLYTYTTEHSPSQPTMRGQRLHAIDLSTGTGIWNLTGNMSPGAIADGYLTASNSYNGYMYVIGKGQSETTVTGPDTAVPLGTAITIRGKVLDMSPAQPGTPCVDANSMATQMQYLHMQHPIDGVGHDEMITGVPVTLTAIDSDGNGYNIGTVTSEGYYGTFGKSWTPPKQDTYTIIASFAGDESYGSSGDSTFVTVGPAPSAATPETEPPTTAPPTTAPPTTAPPTSEAPTTAPPTSEAPTTAPPTSEEPSGEAPFPTTEVVILAAIIVAVVIGIGAYWVLRRQK